MVRLLKCDEKMNIKSLYEKVFVEDEETYRQYFYDKVLPLSDVMVYEDNGIKGMITMIPKKVTIGNNETICRYIYGVATEPLCRRQGIMDKIMKSCLSYLEDDCFTYLIPSSPENAKIYEKYGFSYVMDKTEPKASGVADKDISVRKADRTDIDLLSAFGEKCASRRYGIYLTKNEAYFEETFEKLEAENGYIEIYEKNTEIVGYRTGFDDETVEFLMDDAVYKEEGCKIHNDKKPYIMARILNAEKMAMMVGQNEDFFGKGVFINDYI